MEPTEEFLFERKQMVQQQIVRRGIQDQRLLDVLEGVPRHVFVPPMYQHLAYADGPLPIGEGQTISQPYIVALMTSLLELEGHEKVLEIGTGSGYQAAILAGLVQQVYTIETHSRLAERARKKLKSLGINNVSVIIGDGSLGLAEFSPYQAILVTAAAPRVPRPLIEQLEDGGRLVVPVGGEYGQYLQVLLRKGNNFRSREVTPVAFVPLRGEHGWSSAEWHENEWRL